MKIIFTLLAIAATFAACNSEPDLETQKNVVLTDTSRMYNSNASTDVAAGKAAPVQQAPQVRTITRTRTIYVNRAERPVLRRRAPQQVIEEQPPVTTLPQSQNSTASNSTSSSTQGTSPASTGTSESGTAASTEKPKREGWSNAAKDAVIGGVGGAIAGAVISKKKGTGAIIGGVLGAAGGYIIGRKKDKKEQADQPITANYTNY